jgi:neprilysin
MILGKILLKCFSKKFKNSYFIASAVNCLQQQPEVCKPDLCLTPGCIHTASKILSSLDPTVKPCDDFYHFACGKFINETNIPDDKVLVSTFTILDDKLQEQLRSILSKPAKNSEAAPFRLAKELYTKCLNKSRIEEQGIKPMLKIHKSLGDWPVLKGDDWDEQSWTWEQSVKQFRKIGYSTDYILDFSTGPDMKNTTRRNIDVSAIH